MEDLDPYAELSLERDASPADVQKAFKARAKQTHPDVPGGSPEAFQRTKSALTILDDPRKRAEFDETGAVAAEKSKGEQIQQLIANQIALLVQEYAKSGFKPHLDPCRRDVMALVAAALQKEIAAREGGIRNGDRVTEVFGRMRDRLSRAPPGDPIGLMIAETLRANAKAKAAVLKEIELHAAALAVVRHYRFRPDVQAFGGIVLPDQWGSTATWPGGGSGGGSGSG
jgi:curved DNA-binding protein CbpA